MRLFTTAPSIVTAIGVLSTWAVAPASAHEPVEPYNMVVVRDGAFADLKAAVDLRAGVEAAKTNLLRLTARSAEGEAAGQPAAIDE